jgi:hypothetical protein
MEPAVSVKNRDYDLGIIKKYLYLKFVLEVSITSIKRFFFCKCTI